MSNFYPVFENFQDGVAMIMFDEFSYSRYEICTRLSYINCKYLIRFHEPIRINSKGTKYWDVHSILTDSMNQPLEELHRQINHVIVEENDVTFYECAILYKDTENLKLPIKPPRIVLGFVFKDKFFYTNPSTKVVTFERFEPERPSRYPGIEIVSVIGKEIRTMDSKLMERLNWLVSNNSLIE